VSLKQFALFSTFLLTMLNLSVSLGANDWDDLTFKLQLEKNLVQESRSIVESVLPKTHYYIVLSVTLESLPQAKAVPNIGNELNKVFSEAELKALAQNSDRIYLDKLGGWTTAAASPEVVAQAKQRTIQKINVTLGYDETLELKKVEGVKKTLEILYKGYSKNVTLQLEKQQIFVAPEKEVISLTLKDWVQLLKEPLTYLVIALMGLLGYLTTNSKFINVEKEKVAAMNASAQAATQNTGSSEAAFKPNDVPSAEKPVTSGAMPTPAQDLKIKELVDKVENICATNLQDIKTLVKEFLAEESFSANCSLTFLASSLNVETLKKLTALLNPAERTKWKKCLFADFDLEKITVAHLHLSKSISQFYLEENDASDKEVREMMKQLSPRDAAQLLKKNAKLSAFLFNNLSTIQLTRLVALLDSDVLATALKDSMLYSEGDHRDVINTLKTELQDVKAKNDNVINPFLEKSFDLIKDVPLVKEEAIFSAIAMTGQEEILSKMAIENLPSSLILELPLPFLMISLNRFKLERRVEIILSRSEEDKNKLLLCYGETGKNREIIDLEIQTVALNQIKMRTITKNKDALWTEFVKGVRSYYRGLAEEPVEVEELRIKWVKDFIAKNKGATNVTSQAS